MTSFKYLFLFIFIAFSAACADDESPAVDAAVDAGTADAAPGDLTSSDASDGGAAACAARCKTFERCEPFSAAECSAACAKNARATSCLTTSKGCAGVKTCLGFSAGPYGAAPGKLADDFSLKTDAGDWSFKTNFSSADSYVFLLTSGGQTYADQLWRSQPSTLLSLSPKNVHFFFLSYKDQSGTDNAAANIKALKTRVDAAVAKLSSADQAHWNKRLHYVSTEATSIAGWFGAYLKSNGPLAFAIDRFQRIREVGLLRNPGQSNAKGEMYFLANEAIYFNFEFEREQWLDQNVASAKRVPLFAGDAIGGSWGAGKTKTLTLPDAATMATYDTMLFDLGLYCKDGLQKNCGDWDYLVYLYLCTDPKDTKTCKTEMGRWITPYKRPGRWLVDMSPWLPLLSRGGQHTLRFQTAQTYNVHLTAYLGTKGTDKSHPKTLKKLFTGGKFDSKYNDKYQALAFTPPAGTTKVELVALISGHGFGKDTENCAEFCNHTHHFTINGTEFVKKHPEAKITSGCFARVKNGVVPNQFGTWPFGRGGWCPGLEVTPYVADVTSAVKLTGQNSISYKGLLDGVKYVPVPTSGSSGFNARIDMISYLVFWGK